jgi:hypothetical protein
MDTNTLYQVAAHIGKQCDFNTRQNLLFASKCFRDVHAFRTHHTWTIRDPCDMRFKMSMIRKFKTSLKTLRIHIHTSGVQGLSDIVRENPQIIFTIIVYVDETKTIIPGDSDIDICKSTNLKLETACFTDVALQTVMTWMGVHPHVLLYGINITQAEPLNKGNMLKTLYHNANTHGDRIEKVQIGELRLFPYIDIPDSIESMKKIHCIEVEVGAHLRGAVYFSLMHFMATAIIDKLDFTKERFLIYRDRCSRLTTIMFENICTTPLLTSTAHVDPIDLICASVRPNAKSMIVFSELCLLDPAIITLIRQLHKHSAEKQLGITFGIYISTTVHYQIALAGRIASRHLSSLIKLVDDGPNFEQDTVCTYKDLLCELEREAPRCASVWSMLAPPQAKK